MQADAALGNSPMWFGGNHSANNERLILTQYILEWGLPTQFRATDAFLLKWADAQKRAYSMGAGWIVRHSAISISCQLTDVPYSFGTLKLRYLPSQGI